MYRTKAPKKWWVPENAEQKKAFESGKDDVLIALSVCKEGVWVNKCLNIIAESTGSMIPYRKMGFNDFREFLFHIDDVLEVRASYTESNRYYLFVRESALSEECRHIRRLVEGQINAKTNKRQVRATIRNTRAVSSDVLLGYKPSPSYVLTGIGSRGHHTSTSSYSFPARPQPQEFHQAPRNYSSNSNSNPVRIASMASYGVDDDSEDDDAFDTFDMVSAPIPLKPPTQIPLQQTLPRPKTPPPPATQAKPDGHVTRPSPDLTSSQLASQQLNIIAETKGVEDHDSKTNTAEGVIESDTNCRPSLKFQTEVESFLRRNKFVAEANRIKINDLEAMTNGNGTRDETGMESRIQREDDGCQEKNPDWEYPVGVEPTSIDWLGKNWQHPGLPIPVARVPLLKMTMFRLAQYQNDENFQLVSVGNMEEIHKLTADMTLWYNLMKEVLPEIELENLRRNGVYAGFDITRNEWTRVQLDMTNGVHKDRLLVLNIDSGITSRMERCDLRYLLPKYATVPRRAYSARLYSCKEPLPNNNESNNVMNKQVGDLHRASVVAQLLDTLNGVPSLVVLLISLASQSSEMDFRNHVRIALEHLTREVGANVPSDFQFC